MDTNLNDIDVLNLWLKSYVPSLEYKIENMKRVVPDHRNIKFFEGQLNMINKILKRINKINNNDENEKGQDFPDYLYFDELNN
jgi:hypothetical protein